MRSVFILILLTIFMQNIHAQETVAKGSVEEQILDFYKSWLCAETMEQTAMLEEKYMTPEMKRKKERIIGVCGVNPFLRAQDYTEYTINSLLCTHLDGNWYNVSFQHEENSKRVNIPIRVLTDKKYEKTLIAYVVPEWGGEQYGDSLFLQNNSYKSVMDKSTRHDAETFIKSFYRQYINLYVRMESSMEQGLEELRTKFCAQVLNEKFKEAADFNREDCGCDSYDLLVNNFDFDVFWIADFTINPEGADIFRISYKYKSDDSFVVSFQVKVCEENGYYKLENILL